LLLTAPWFVTVVTSQEAWLVVFITGPPTHSVGGQYCFALWRLSSSVGSVTPHGGPAGGFTRAGQAMTSCRLQSNYRISSNRSRVSNTSRVSNRSRGLLLEEIAYGI